MSWPNNRDGDSSEPRVTQAHSGARRRRGPALVLDFRVKAKSQVLFDLGQALKTDVDHTVAQRPGQPSRARASSRHRFKCIDLSSLDRGGGFYLPPRLLEPARLTKTRPARR